MSSTDRAEHLGGLNELDVFLADVHTLLTDRVVTLADEADLSSELSMLVSAVSVIGTQLDFRLEAARNDIQSHGDGIVRAMRRYGSGL